MRYFFVPGRKWELACEEIKCVLKSQGINYSSLIASDSVISFSSSCDSVGLADVFNRLGGFVRYGQLLDDPFVFIEDFVKEASGKRVLFSISTSLKVDPRRIFKLGLNIKKYMKKLNIHSRFVFKRGSTEASGPLVVKSGVLEKGFELFLLEINGKKEWGRTLGIQDFEAFSKRDYGRPCPDKKKGMLPPKLARIMVNLSMSKKEDTVWDPFCGSGTVIQESLLLGLNAVGTDVDEKSVENCKKNLDWLVKEFSISNVNYTVFKQDAMKELIDKIEFDSIVTEPYLGPVLLSLPDEHKVDLIIKDLTNIYLKFFKNVIRCCKKGIRIVFVAPKFRLIKGWKDIPVKKYLPVGMKEILGDRNLHWDRPNSMIVRQVKIFEVV